jgi:hypothetical protein
MFHAQGNVNSPWAFTNCVKLVHGAASHSWWATGAVTALASGMHVQVFAIHVESPAGTVLASGPFSVVHTDFATSDSDPYPVPCNSTRSIKAVVGGRAQWPNGVPSADQTTETATFTVSC